MSPDDDAWFAHKRYGYGAGRPISRQGWAALFGYILLICLAGFLARYSRAAFAIIVAAASVVFILICARKTQGGWRWRWGDRK